MFDKENSISITGLVVLGGNTSIADPNANFRDAFAGTRSDANGLVNALVRITFSYQGFQNCFNVMNEIKVRGLISRLLSSVQLTRSGSDQNDQEIGSDIIAPGGDSLHAL